MKRGTVVALVAASATIYGALALRRLAARVRLTSTFPAGPGVRLDLEPRERPR